MKSVVVINTPENCRLCPFRESPWNFCLGEYEKEKHCPLRPLPQKKEIMDAIQYRGLEEEYRKEGWNECIDEIIASDRRFEIIARAKEDLIRSTNIETSEDEMKVLDSFLFRCWQMGWLPDFQDTNVGDTISRQAAIAAVSEACFELRGVFGRCEDALKALPSAEPRITHCKDCKYNVANMEKDPLDINNYTDIVCSYFMTDGLEPNDYCSKGELYESNTGN